MFVTDASVDGGAVAAVGNGWTETGITWSNAPPVPSTPLARAGQTTLNTWVEVDVTPAVTGNGEVSFALTTTSSDSQYHASRQAPTVAFAAAAQPAGGDLAAVCPLMRAPVDTAARARASPV